MRLIDFVYHSTLGLRVMKKKKKTWAARTVAPSCAERSVWMEASGSGQEA